MMTSADPLGNVDQRFGDESAGPTAWSDVQAALRDAELYWITTVRDDGRPHVTPLIGLFLDDTMHFCTGIEEQKAKNLEKNPHCTLTTGRNTWNEGLDIVVEGSVVRIADESRLQQIADAIEEKYGAVWHFDVKDGGFDGGGGTAHVFAVSPSSVFAFAKAPHSQTRFQFSR